MFPDSTEGGALMRPEMLAPLYVLHAKVSDLRPVLDAWDRLEALSARCERRAKAVRLSRAFWWTYNPEWDGRGVFLVTRAELQEEARQQDRAALPVFMRHRPKRGVYFEKAATS